MALDNVKKDGLTAADIQYNLDILAGKTEYPSSIPGERRKISPADINSISLEFLGIFAEQLKSMEHKKGADQQTISKVKADISSITGYVLKTIERNCQPSPITSPKAPLSANPPSLSIPQPLTSEKPASNTSTTSTTPLSPSFNPSSIISPPASLNGPLRPEASPKRTTLSLASDIPLTSNPAKTISPSSTVPPSSKPVTAAAGPLLKPPIPSSETEGLHGIPNRGNTCFMNATFQMIMNDPAVSGEVLMAYLDQKARLEREGKQRTEAEYYNACTAVISAIEAYGEGRKNDIDLNPLRALLRSRGAHDNGLEFGTMGDAEEFFYALIHPALNPALIGSDQSTEYTCQPYVPSSAVDARKYSLSTLQENRHRSKLVNGRLRGNQTNFDSIIRLEPVKNAQGQALLNALLASKPHSGEPIPCEDGWYVPIAERLSLDPLPQRFVASIKRFKPTLSGTEKNDDSIYMPENLTIGSQRYLLKSITLHSSAHYKAYVKKNDNWFTANDSVISKTNRDELQMALEKGYLYFYEKAQ